MKPDDWMNRKWRPAMGWMYMVVCIMDFIVFPVMWSGFNAYLSNSLQPPWDPLTLQGAGLFHLAMGAVLGVAAWSRGQEKLASTRSRYNSFDTEEGTKREFRNYEREF